MRIQMLYTDTYSLFLYLLVQNLTKIIDARFDVLEDFNFSVLIRNHLYNYKRAKAECYVLAIEYFKDAIKNDVIVKFVK